MLIQTLVSYALDRAGGGIAGTDKLSPDAAVSAVLAAIDLYGLERKISGRTSINKTIVSFAGRTGILPNINFKPQLVRRQTTAGSTQNAWQKIDIVETLLDLERMETRGRVAIAFNYDSGLSYHLNFDPLTHLPNSYEIWGDTRPDIESVASLSDKASIPDDFHRLIGEKAAIEIIANLLLPPDGNAWLPFHNARKDDLAREVTRLEWHFNADRTRPNDANEILVREAYSIGDGFDEMDLALIMTTTLNPTVPPVNPLTVYPIVLGDAFIIAGTSMIFVRSNLPTLWHIVQLISAQKLLVEIANDSNFTPLSIAYTREMTGSNIYEPSPAPIYTNPVTKDVYIRVTNLETFNINLNLEPSYI